MLESEFSEKLGYYFVNKELLIVAITHPSSESVHNEKLEFLGDSLLYQIVTEYLYSNYQELTVGELSVKRDAIISNSNLTNIAYYLLIDKIIICGNSVNLQQLDHMKKSLADVVEALFAAIYIDGGYHVTRNCVLKLCMKDANLLHIKSHKSTLQEILQAKHEKLPIYSVIGKSTDGMFTINCVAYVQSKKIETTGTGSRVRQAEEMAASLMITQLNC
ncbi:MAG: ribonuclease III domain-containing protein [Methylacidiphilales bacterium]|nr:ribonuclease III domain-containing protein [Candidatus Methylacidiphilales bacterium]